MPAKKSSSTPFIETGKPRDQFLSEEDLDLKNLSWEELIEVWNQWLSQASVTDEQDADQYSHGVFTTEPGSRGERV